MTIKWHVKGSVLDIKSPKKNKMNHGIRKVRNDVQPVPYSSNGKDFGGPCCGYMLRNKPKSSQYRKNLNKPRVD